MKITPREDKKSRYNTGKDELRIIQLDDVKDEKLKDKIGRYLTYGLTAYDKKGHTTELRFKIRPIARDMIGQVASKLPDGYFKTAAHLYRGIFAVGCAVALDHIKKNTDHDITTVTKIFDYLNDEARNERIDEIESELNIKKQVVMSSDSCDIALKLKEIDNLLKELKSLKK